MLLSWLYAFAQRRPTTGELVAPVAWVRDRPAPKAVLLIVTVWTCVSTTIAGLLF